MRNWLLIAASLVFYAWGNLYYVLLMALSCLINYFIIRALTADHTERTRKTLLIIAIAVNIGMLAVFKYSAFAVESFNGVFKTAIPVPKILSPLGISFFTFQAVSCVIDTYRRDIIPSRDFCGFLLYISFFAQLVQGPIIRYAAISEQLENRRITLEGAAEGLRHFIIGLSMKLIIANTMGRVSSYVYGFAASDLDALLAWTGAVSFLLQIYFDFAGYSRMAVGLGLMFGFTIPENFNYPYIAYSMTDFWRRWHITLSRWFRDYVYIPLGGNRKGAFRTGLNKIIVFLLTGLWHGANWTFVFWGAYNGVFLLGENYLKKTKLRLPKVLTWVYTIIAVTVGFAVFNSPDMGYAFAMIRNMFAGFNIGVTTGAGLSAVIKPTVAVVFIIGVVAATPLSKIICSKLDGKPVLQAALRYSFAVLLLVLCLFYVASGNYNPSIYTKF